MNKYYPHVFVIPEDEADRQLAHGFVLHHRVDTRRVEVMRPAAGWGGVLKTFEDEYVPLLRSRPHAHVVMLIDFDDHIVERRAEFDRAIPADLKARTFLLGSRHNPETLKRAMRVGFEGIGRLLADDCDAQTWSHWNHDQLQHNDAERQRLVQTVRPFLFP